MKIKINEFESYEITLEDKEISPQRFFEILSRLNIIAKVIGKSVQGDILLTNEWIEKEGWTKL